MQFSSNGRMLVLGGTLALLASGAAPGRSDDAASAGKDAVARIAAAEAKAPNGRLPLAIHERRGPYKQGETLEALTKRLAGETSLEAQGFLVFGPDGWLKDLTVQGKDGKPSTHSRAAESAGLLRLLLEATVDGMPQKVGRVSRLTVTAPADAILSRRVGRALQGVEWSAATSEGELLHLRGTRSTERYNLVLHRLGGEPAGYEVRSWELTRFLVGPNGESLEQTTTCQVTPGDTPGSVSKLEEWVVNRPPLANVAHRITEVRKGEDMTSVPAEQLALRFPRGTHVTDARGEVPVEYEQTEEGVKDEDVARTAAALAAGRAKPGEPAPAFEVKDLKGKPVRLADFRGKVLVLFWFSTGSTRAEEAARFIQGLHESYKGRGVQVLGLSIAEEGDPQRKAEEYRKRSRWSFPVAIDPGETMRRYGAEAGVPKVAIVDARGMLTYARAGIDPDEVEAALDRLVGKGKEKG